MSKKTPWQEQAHRIVLEYLQAGSTAEKITYVENLGDKSTDLAVWDEILRLAVLGAATRGLYEASNN